MTGGSPNISSGWGTTVIWAIVMKKKFLIRPSSQGKGHILMFSKTNVSNNLSEH